MDLSESYVKMCMEAEEVHNLHKPYSKWISFDTQEFFVARDYKDYGKVCFWLPRQDQLQELVIDPEGDRPDVFSLFNMFNHWQMNTVPMLEATAEKLWLAFVMYYRFDKLWDDKENRWVKEKR